MKDCHLTGCEHPSVRLGPELLIQSMTTSFHPGRGTKESFGGPEREGGFSSKGEEVTSGFLWVETPPVSVLFWRQEQWHHSGGDKPAVLAGLMVALGNLLWGLCPSSPFPAFSGSWAALKWGAQRA